jgi:N-acetylmuramoyl-L-alanine amidase
MHPHPKRLAISALLLALLPALAPEPARASCDRAGFPVAVDIGHTPESTGATSARGIPEFAFNMALGRDAVAALHAAGFPAQRLIVSGAGREQLARRVAAARDMRPALVISIHHDSVQEHYLQSWRFAGQERRFSDRFSGFSIFVSEENDRFRESLAFARELGRELTGAGLTFSTHHAEPIPGENRKLLDPATGVFGYRQLRVLKDAPAPAVLLEAGVIVNRQEEMALASPARRKIMADALVRAVTTMCDRHGDRLVLR